MKLCFKCNELKPYEEYAKAKSNKDGFYHLCRKCQSEVRKDYPSTKAVKNYSKHNLSLEDYVRLLEAQDSRCAVCQKYLNLEDASIDHDHNCCPESYSSCGRCVRGLLCKQCNVGLGMFKDNPVTVAGAFRYLNTTRSGVYDSEEFSFDLIELTDYALT